MIHVEAPTLAKYQHSPNSEWVQSNALGGKRGYICGPALARGASYLLALPDLSFSNLPVASHSIFLLQHDTMLNLVFLLDITGSMGSQVEGVKKTVGKLVASVFDQDYDVMLTVITFTEDSRGCYITDDRFTDGEEAQSFISSLTLCVPPGSTGINANGGDGDENTKAAIAQLLKLDNSMPTVAFLITDAGPHLTADSQTSEATHEVQFLKKEHGIVDTDMMHILSLVSAHFEHNLMLNVIKYFKSSDHRLYGAVAKQMGGVLVTPREDSANRLAAGLFSILNQMFTRCLGGAATSDDAVPTNELEGLDAFDFYDLEGVELVEREADVSRNQVPPTGDTRDVLFAFLERATVVIGDKFAKRAVEAAGLLEQVELLLIIAKCATHTMSLDSAVDKSTTLIAAIREKLPEENQGHFKFSADNFAAVLAEIVASAAVNAEPEHEAEHRKDTLSAASVSAITLLTTEEAVVDALGETEETGLDPRVVLETAASLFLSHMAVLQLPVKNGRADFMDAWASVITEVSGDVVTAKDFLALIAAETSTTGLSIRDHEYNYAQIMADPSDSLACALLRAASGTQVLDVLTALLAGAPAGKFCPNMFRGTTASALMGLLMPPSMVTKGTEESVATMSEFQWQIAHKLVHSARLIMGKRPASMVCEPESAVSKMVFQLLRLALDGDAKTQAVRAVLEEILASQIQRMAKYNERRYLGLVQRVVQYEHVSEEVEDVFLEHPLDKELWSFDVQEAKQRAAASPMFAWFKSAAQNVITAVYSDDKIVPTLSEVWPEVEDAVPKLVLLQKRTGRYTLEATEGEGATREWRRSNVLAQPLASDMYTSAAMQQLRKKHETFLRELRARRENMAAERRWQLALHHMRAPMAEFVEKLRTLVVDNASLEHMLLLRALKLHGASELEPSEFEDKVTVVVTGRDVLTREVVFNRGNLLANPTKFVPMSEEFQVKLRALRAKHSWPLAHTYRASGKPNRHGFSNASASQWAARRVLPGVASFWDA